MSPFGRIFACSGQVRARWLKGSCSSSFRFEKALDSELRVPENWETACVDLTHEYVPIARERILMEKDTYCFEESTRSQGVPYSFVIEHRYAQAIGTRDAVDFENALAASSKASKAALFQSPSAREY
ncbi:hypothetical protein AnigIFM50267_004880 [Aspergillus niger]|nr:hypothetical protein AnigIFM50267_004880 [Aspergillus niger]